MGNEFKKNQHQVKISVGQKAFEDIAIIEDYFEAPLSKLAFTEMILFIKKKRAEVPETYVINRR
jgi:hypothetical protein